jgi:hypothetical protein
LSHKKTIKTESLLKPPLPSTSCKLALEQRIGRALLYYNSSNACRQYWKLTDVFHLGLKHKQQR